MARFIVYDLLGNYHDPDREGVQMKRSYTIILTNCDCSSDVIARTSTKWIFGPRCPGCKKILGFMEWQEDLQFGKIRANEELEAIRIYLKRRQAKSKER